MISFSYHCPFCNERNGFHINAVHPAPIGQNLFRVGVLAGCLQCYRSVSTTLDLHSANVDRLEQYLEDAETYPLDLLTREFFITPSDAPRFFPLPPEPDIPEHLPDAVRRKFQAAEKQYLICKPEQNSDLVDLAGNAYRAALETALALLDNGQDKNLNQRIRQLVSQGRLTEEMGQFAHRIRQLGNQASHSTLAFSRAELDDLRLFCRLFMLYCFTLPAMIPPTETA